MKLSAPQVRAARGLLGWSRDVLAEQSGVAIRTLGRFEAEEAYPRAAAVAAIRTALEAAGVEFIAENGGGPGVRLRKLSSGVGDLRAMDINDWATAAPPKDGAAINVKFADGTHATAKWSVPTNGWEVLRRNGKWAPMRNDHGASTPVSWWR